MRNNQISIKLDSFIDIQNGGIDPNHRIVVLYADSNNIYETLAAAYERIIEEIEESGKIEAWQVKNGGEYEKIAKDYIKAIQEIKKDKKGLPEFGCVESSKYYK